MSLKNKQAGVIMSRYEIGPKEMKELDMHQRIIELEKMMEITVKSIDTIYHQIDTLEKIIKLKINPEP